jgi:tryptophan-rich sensory protein
MNITSIIVLIGFVGVCFLAAATGAMFRPGDWYQQLRKPPGVRRTECFPQPGHFSI